MHGKLRVETAWTRTLGFVEHHRASYRRVASKGWAVGALFVVVAASGLVFLATRVAKPDGEPAQGIDLREAARRESAFRRTGGVEAASLYAEALLALGRYDSFFQLLKDEPLASDETRTALLLRAEGLTRLNRYDEALRELDAFEASDPLGTAASLLRARALYRADAGKADAAVAELHRAVASQPAVAAEAWMLRARIALDVGLLGDAQAAANRALESGAPGLRVAALHAEASMRAGDVDVAERLILKNLLRKSHAARAPAPETERLLALVDLARGRPQDAARRLDRIASWLDQEPRGPLLRALAKFESGETAQGEQLLRRFVADHPNDWVARDLALEARVGEPEPHLSALDRTRPGLAAARRLIAARAASDEAAVYAAATSAGFGRDVFGGGARSFLLGARDKSILAPADLGLAGLRAAEAAPLRETRRLVDAQLAMRRGAADLLVSAMLLAADGDTSSAADLVRQAAPAGVWTWTAAAQVAALSPRAEAARLLADFLSLQPDSLGARTRLAKLIDDGSGPADAAAVLDPAAEALAMAGSLEDAVFYVRILVGAGRLADADVFAAAAAQRLLRAVDRARMAEALGDMRTAAHHYRQALIAHDAGHDPAAGYARAKIALGEAAEAAALLGQAALRRPDDAKLQDALSKAQEAAGLPAVNPVSDGKS